ncbi:MAG: hypothetical protein AAGI22_29990 [Planctomycetota bacterium]
MYSNPAGFRLLQAQRRLARPFELRRRRRAAADLIARVKDPLRIDPELGYRWIEPGELQGIDALVDSCTDAIDDARPHVERLVEAAPGRFRIAFDFLGDDRVHDRPELVDAMVSDELLACASDYLGAVPVLRRVAIGYSPGQVDTDHAWAGSQLFHYDGEDDRQVKMFVLLTDVEDERHGPLTFLSAAASKRVSRALGDRPEGPIGSYMRAGPYTDEQVRQHASPDEFLKMTGKRGRVLLLDTCATLHQGSRVHHGHERIVFMGVLQRYHLVHATPYNWFDASRHEPGTVQRLALTPPDPRPRNFFFPDPLDPDAATVRRGAG